MQGKYKALWLNNEDNLVVIDQRVLPFKESTVTITNAQETVDAIYNMTVRGAGVIGDVAAFGVYLAAREVNADFEKLKILAQEIRKSRPTAVNLMWAVDRMLKFAKTKLSLSSKEFIEALKNEAIKITDEDSNRSQQIANYGADIIEKIMRDKHLKSFNILTHCNAGWLAIVDKGSALAPIYEAHNRGIDIHVWVDETRPRNQGANLTAWELLKAGINHTVIADNVGGHLMQHNKVDMVITGADRVAKNGDSANKIGTYLKALAANDNNVPFYIAIPASTFDFEITDGIKDIPIEIRDDDEVKFIRGIDNKGNLQTIQIVPTDSKAINYSFDVTPAKYITGIITERGICKANITAVSRMFEDLI